MSFYNSLLNEALLRLNPYSTGRYSVRYEAVCVEIEGQSGLNPYSTGRYSVRQ